MRELSSTLFDIFETATECFVSQKIMFMPKKNIIPWSSSTDVAFKWLTLLSTLKSPALGHN